MGLLSREQHADTGSLSQSQCACGRSLDPVVSDEGNRCRALIWGGSDSEKQQIIRNRTKVVESEAICTLVACPQHLRVLQMDLKQFTLHPIEPVLYCR